MASADGTAMLMVVLVAPSPSFAYAIALEGPAGARPACVEEVEAMLAAAVVGS